MGLLQPISEVGWGAPIFGSVMKLLITVLSVVGNDSGVQAFAKEIAYSTVLEYCL